MKTIFFCTALLTVFTINQLFAQYYGAITIDRPGYSNTYTTVKKMRFQIESGLSYFSDKNFPQNPDLERVTLQAAASTLRFGVTKRFEVRLGGQFTYQRDKVQNVKTSVSSIQGLSLGAKFRTFEHHGFLPDGALLVNLGLPVGSRQLVSNKVEPGALFIGSHPLSEAARLEYNVGLTYRDADYFEYLGTLVLNVSFSEQTSAFIEYVVLNPENGAAQQIFDFGLSLLIKRNVIFDIYGGKGLNKEAQDWFVSVGGGIRLPR